MRRPANVESVFLWSITVMVASASIILSAAEGARFPTGITPFLAIATHYLVDVWKRVRLSVLWANVLGVLAFIAMGWEFTGGNVLTKLISGAHLLVYMTWVVLLMQKGIRQFWWLAALCMLQVSVASVLTTDATFGLSLVWMLLLMVWTMSVFTLFRTRRRLARATDGVEDSLETATESDDSVLMVRNGLQLDPREPWIGWRFRIIVGFNFAASLVIAAITFAVFPRIWVPQSPLAGLQQSENSLVSQTGFTDEVQLGEIGQIMQSDARVFQYRIFRMNGVSKVEPERFADAMCMDEILFRGNALGHYENGRWTSGSIQGRSVGDLENRRRFVRDARKSDFRILITQDPPIQKIAFAPTPVSNAIKKDRNGRIEQRQFSYSLIHRYRENDSRNTPAEYEVWCQAAAPDQRNHRPRQRSLLLQTPIDWRSLYAPSRFERSEFSYANDWCITRNVQSALPRLSQIASELCTENGELVTPQERVDRVFHYLNTSGEFTYSMNIGVTDSSLDPLEDFLVNQKSGHCEYFASACALMIQSVGVPARIVNGFKGSDLNAVSGVQEVKQRHAHTWLEAYVNRQWVTYDPTPAAPREELVAKSGQLDWWTDLRLAFSDNWFDVVQKMSLQRQEAIVRPLLKSLSNTWETIKQQGLVASFKMFYVEVILQPKKWVSVQTGIVTFFTLLILGLTIRAQPIRRLLNRVSELIAWFTGRGRDERSIVRFYENFQALCVRHGLYLSQNQTARENAALARNHFASRLQSTEDRQLPDRIARTFNLVRFGAKELSPEVVNSIREDVSRFSQLLSAPVSKATS